MPHTREVQPTSHDRHDPMLVAALAADDLAGADRDQAIDLTRTCPDCAVLHDDLLALARATAAAPPPFAPRRRDFRLTPADAARLRPSAWRRLVAAVSKTPSALSRPMGVGLATIGLVGLLVGNLQIGSFMGSSASTPAPRAAAAAPSTAFAANPDMVSMPSGVDTAGQVPAAAGAGSGSVAVPAASSAPGAPSSPGNVSTDGAGSERAVTTADGKSTSGTEAPVVGLTESNRDTVTPEPSRPLNLLFGAAVVVGIGILVVLRLRSRRPT